MLYKLYKIKNIEEYAIFCYYNNVIETTYTKDGSFLCKCCNKKYEKQLLLLELNLSIYNYDIKKFNKIIDIIERTVKPID